MAYRVPIDLLQKSAVRAGWPLAERIKAAVKVRPGAPPWAKLAAVAITLNEQPREIWNGNCCGIMSQGTVRPWGWRDKHWTSDTTPNGYVLLKEGATGKFAPFLAFPEPDYSLAFLIDRCVARRIRDGESYARLWVGEKEHEEVIASLAGDFDRAYDRAVGALWDLVARQV